MRSSCSTFPRRSGVRAGAALINVQRVAYDAYERPVECVDLVYRGDRYVYDLTLFR